MTQFLVSFLIQSTYFLTLVSMLQTLFFHFTAIFLYFLTYLNSSFYGTLICGFLFNEKNRQNHSKMGLRIFITLTPGVDSRPVIVCTPTASTDDPDLGVKVINIPKFKSFKGTTYFSR